MKALNPEPDTYILLNVMFIFFIAKAIYVESLMFFYNDKLLKQQ